MSTLPFYKPPKRVVLTGGPGAGKTAVLEMARRELCRHVEVLPEAAAIVFGGGFPRRSGEIEQRAVQRAIFWIQNELESLAHANDALATVLCDRGTIDGLAYWPGHRSDFFAELRTSMYEELRRYDEVIHLRVPPDPTAYRGTTIRRETHEEALAIDARLLEAWAEHPRRIVIDGTQHFMEKASAALEAIRSVSAEHVCDEAAALV
ncbi:MAG: ATP-binding protein [Labilithrix sp.]|nr:ATP-binding protein [Labilithrix sp.]MCW5812595.1 ATP-binding protein [Labilithrix sp.]